MYQHSLAKACRECIRAKKKCNRRLPLCKRCAMLSKTCSYQNEPLQEPPDLAKIIDPMQLVLAAAKLCQPDFRCNVDVTALPYIINKMKTYPSTMFGAGNVPFIHQRLYRRFRRPWALVVLDSLPHGLDRNPDCSHLGYLDALDVIIETVLRSESSLISLLDRLGFLQAFMIIQIMTIFRTDLSTRQRRAAHARQKHLVHCSEKLWASAPKELPQFLLPCDAYILGESVRRTLLCSYTLQAAYCIMWTGQFAHTPFGSALVFDAVNSTLWESDCMEGDCLHKNANVNLLSYREYVNLFEAGKAGQLSAFEKLLLVGCHGVESIEAGHVTKPITSRGTW